MIPKRSLLHLVAGNVFSDLFASVSFMLCIKVTLQSPNDFGQTEFPDRQQCIWQFSNKFHHACRVRMHKEEKLFLENPFLWN